MESPILGFKIPIPGTEGVVDDIVDALLALESAAVGPDFIHGLLLSWVSNSSITIATGAARPPSDELLTVETAITVSSISLGNNTWGHVYLYDNAGTPAVEVVTTAPVSYFGHAYQKTGDATRRYLGSVRTDGSGGVYKFYHQNDTVYYLENTQASPFRVLSAGTATTETSVSLAAVVPPTSLVALVNCLNTSTVGAALGNASERDTTNLVRYVYPSGGDEKEIPLAGAQAMTYKYASSPGAGALYIDVQGYRFVR